MAAGKNEDLAKRLSQLGTLICLASLAGVVAFVNQIESDKMPRDVETLGYLERLQDISGPRNMKDPYDLHLFMPPWPSDDAKWQSRGGIWLEKHRSDINDKRFRLRKLVIEWLIQQGLPSSDMDQYGGLDGGRISSRPFYFVEFLDDELRSKFRFNSVNWALDRSAFVTRPVKLQVATALADELPKLADSGIAIRHDVWVMPPNKRQELQRNSAWGLLGLKLKGKALDLEFIDLTEDMGLSPSKRGDPFRHVKIPVATEVIESDSLLALCNLLHSHPDVPVLLSDLRELHQGDAEQVERLRLVFGKFEVKLASQTARSGMARVYSTLNILGFAVPSTVFPWAIFFAVFAAMGATALYLREATAASISGLREARITDSSYILVRYRLARIFLWIILPIMAVWISLPPAGFAFSEKIWLAIGSFLLGLVGVWCVFKAGVAK